jgi:hypothetical protein
MASAAPPAAARLSQVLRDMFLDPLIFLSFLPVTSRDAARMGYIPREPRAKPSPSRRRGLMFDPISIPFGARMLLNTVKLKPGISMEDVELAIGEMCNVVTSAYGGDAGGFIAGQVFRFSGFVSDAGSVGAQGAGEHVAIVTYWRSFEDHERSHADALFTAKFAALVSMCSESQELGYEMMWQGEAATRSARAPGAGPTSSS